MWLMVISYCGLVLLWIEDFSCLGCLWMCNDLLQMQYRFGNGEGELSGEVSLLGFYYWRWG